MISFIIPAYNEELLLGSTLDALRQAAKSVGVCYEIIVVDDGSSDRTSEVALEHGARTIRVMNRQIAATRNAGAKIAKGDYFLFVDADTVIFPAVLQEALCALRNGAVGGGATIKFDGRVPLYGRVMEFLACWGYRFAKISSGAFIFCTRDAFNRVGGFDENLYASEEAAMSRALGRCGRFVVLKQTVLTSGRKLRLYSTREILGTIARVVLVGGRVTDMKNAAVWYDGKRETAEQSSNANKSRKS